MGIRGLTSLIQQHAPPDAITRVPLSHLPRLFAHKALAIDAILFLRKFLHGRPDPDANSMTDLNHQILFKTHRLVTGLLDNKITPVFCFDNPSHRISEKAAESTRREIIRNRGEIDLGVEKRRVACIEVLEGLVYSDRSAAPGAAATTTTTTARSEGERVDVDVDVDGEEALRLLQKFNGVLRDVKVGATKRRDKREAGSFNGTNEIIQWLAANRVNNKDHASGVFDDYGKREEVAMIEKEKVSDHDGKTEEVAVIEKEKAKRAGDGKAEVAVTVKVSVTVNDKGQKEDVVVANDTKTSDNYAKREEVAIIEKDKVAGHVKIETEDAKTGSAEDEKAEVAISVKISVTVNENGQKEDVKTGSVEQPLMDSKGVSDGKKVTDIAAMVPSDVESPMEPTTSPEASDAKTTLSPEALMEELDSELNRLKEKMSLRKASSSSETTAPVPVEGDNTSNESDAAWIPPTREIETNLHSLKLRATREITSLETRIRRLEADTVRDVKHLLQLMGVPVLESPHEGEALCAYLTQRGLTAATASEDLDVVIFGDGPMLRRLNHNVIAPVVIVLTAADDDGDVTDCGDLTTTDDLLGDEQHPRAAASTSSSELMLIDPVAARTGLGLSHSQMIDLAILCGCDYAPTIRNVGPKRALKFLRTHGSIEAILQANIKGVVAPHEAYLDDVIAARRVFLTAFEGMGHIDASRVVCGAPSPALDDFLKRKGIIGRGARADRVRSFEGEREFWDGVEVWGAAATVNDIHARV